MGLLSLPKLKIDSSYYVLGVVCAFTYSLPKPDHIHI